MVIAIIGESCTGKTTLTNELEKQLDFKLYNGKDYLKLAKSEANARIKFAKILANNNYDDIIIYVIAEKDQLSLLPKNAIKILVTSDLDTIKERFKKRMNNNLPKPIEIMLERKHGMFDDIECDLHLTSTDLITNVNEIIDLIERK